MNQTLDEIEIELAAYWSAAADAADVAHDAWVAAGGATGTIPIDPRSGLCDLMGLLRGYLEREYEDHRSGPYHLDVLADDFTEIARRMRIASENYPRVVSFETSAG